MFWPIMARILRLRNGQVNESPELPVFDSGRWRKIAVVGIATLAQFGSDGRASRMQSSTVQRNAL